MKIKKKYHTVGTFPKCNRTLVERGKIDSLNTNKWPHTQINDR
jgi:hypothetical protein